MNERGATARALEMALDALRAAVELEGGQLLEAMILVHVEGLDMDGSVAAEGMTPDDALEFLLAHLRGMADQLGVPLHIGTVYGENG